MQIIDPRIRPVNLQKDLSSIADLIELCFKENMDSDGRDYIRHIRQIAEGFGGFFIEGTTPETSQLPFHGYVWMEEGEIIGNLTLIKVRKKEKDAYFVANVAVRPDQRGRGIARQLTDRALAHVREHGGKKIYLQVREDNPTAIHIYQTHGFEETARRTTWIYRPGVQTEKQADADLKVTRRRAEDWEQQKLWLQTIYPPSIAWNLPIQLDRYTPGFWNWLGQFLMGVTLRNWTVRRRDELIATATWESGLTGDEYLWLGTTPVWEEAAIAVLLPAAFRSMLNPLKVSINYPAGRGVSAFRQAGMKELHTLVWMVRYISDVDEI